TIVPDAGVSMAVMNASLPSGRMRRTPPDGGDAGGVPQPCRRSPPRRNGRLAHSASRTGPPFAGRNPGGGRALTPPPARGTGQ
ncbi:hypothetical protein, partial [Gluconacetobacter azotocaptans]|uniref:hypothetical protein n=1 Tax=Gluconacetobacter azotocaptans TaxID=142834 RepID=UPI002232BE9D